MRKWLQAIAFLLVLGGIAGAGAIKTWASGEVLTASDLNTVFQHIHNTMVGGGHGARLVDADVNATAGITHSKMANPGLLPKTWAIWKTACLIGTTPCVPSVASGVTDVVWNATGDYSVRLVSGRPNNLYFPVVSAYSATGADTVCAPYGLGTGTTFGSFGVKCYTTGVAADAAFGFILVDDNN